MKGKDIDVNAERRRELGAKLKSLMIEYGCVAGVSFFVYPAQQGPQPFAYSASSFGDDSEVDNAMLTVIGVGQSRQACEAFTAELLRINKATGTTSSVQ